MQELKILNTRECKPILQHLKQQWGYTGTLDWAILKNKKGRMYIVSRDIEKLDLKKLRIDSLGLYIGEISDTGVRVSIEGSQLIGPYCSYNIYNLSEEEFSHWMAGEDIETNKEFTSSFIMIRYNGQFAGSAKYHTAAKKILNHVPKARRIPIT